MVYDQQDRLVLTQDGKLRQQNKWLLLSMINSEGWFIRGYWIVLREGMLSKAIWFILVVIMRREVLLVLHRTEQLFIDSSSAYPVGNFTLLTVNYYDEYPPGSPGCLMELRCWVLFR